ncbi:hypothetical protein PFWH6_4957 [Pseudomonas fluorescens WH6]|nr:hypothetical protein PFWH6_4957 [Pseudomonas fluorescens WH6]
MRVYYSKLRPRSVLQQPEGLKSEETGKIPMWVVF